MPTLPQPLILQNQMNTGITIGPISWIRQRAYPPNDVMPAITIQPTPTSTSNIATTFNDDFSKDSGMWSYFGNAHRLSANQSIVLTDLGGDEAGAILFSPEVTGSFTLNFSYLMGGGSGADGLAVLFYHDQSPYVTGSGIVAGGGLGFTGKGYGVWFDTYYNPSQGDPSNNYVGLIKDSYGNHLSPTQAYQS